MDAHGPGAHQLGVASHLEALVGFLAVQAASCGLQETVLRQLQATSLRWSAGQVVCADLAAQSCEAVVSALRLLSDAPTALPWSSRCAASTCGFLALACTVQAFEDARDVLVPGQAVTISGLQSAAGERLNGAQGRVQRFHAESGRYIVSLNPEDPPSDWKKVRHENLLPVIDPLDAHSVALEGARECGRACLEAVADTFDDLLVEMHEEGEEEAYAVFLHAQLSTAMWEALVCCIGDGGLQLRGAALLELCGQDVTMCNLLARNIFSAHLSSQILIAPPQLQAQTVRRVLCLQESFARAYYGLYQPDALWADQDPQASGGDVGIADLQVALDSHVLRLAASAVQLDLLSSFLHAVDFHVAWAGLGVGPGICPVPLVLPVLLARLICTWASASDAEQGSVVRRHLLLLAPAIVATAGSFVDLVVERLRAKAATSADLMLASQAVLDSIVVLIGHGCMNALEPGGHMTILIEAVVSNFLACEEASADPALLARLVLTLIYMPQTEVSISARQSYALLPVPSKVVFWQQLRARTRLVRSLEVPYVAEWLGEEASAAAEASEAEAEMMAQQGPAQLDLLVEKCVQQLPQSLREAPMPGPPVECAEPEQDLPQTPAAVAAIAALEAAATSSGKASAMEAASRLGALDLPDLPGQQPRDEVKSKASKIKRLGRSDIAQLRGVDPADAPQELRCAIDGKVLGAPLRSPYGHVFERSTLQQWFSSCGSICPITGQPLREEDCTMDTDIEQKVLEWVRAAKAAYKQRKEEKRRRRNAEASAGQHLTEAVQ